MSDNHDYSQLVSRAQFGDDRSLNLLSQEARGELSAYIYRITLDFDLTEDILQETLLEMIRSIKSLKDVQRFKSWLFRIASTRIKKHFRITGNKRIMNKTVFDAEKLAQHTATKPDALSELLKKELSGVITRAMAQLKYNYRNVLILRCFEQMSYPDIAYSMGCSSIEAQLLFFRAKRSLKKQLQEHGYKKEHLLASLGIFGAITALPFKSASASTAAVAPATMKVGALTTVIGAVTTKIGILSTIIAAATLMAVSVPTTLNNHGRFHNSLKDAFKKDFYIGAAVNDNQISGKDKKVKEVIKSQFNSITPENCMKWDTIHPKPDFYDFDQADRFVEFGEKNNMFMVGHIFIDWTQVPDWVFRDSQGKQVDRDTLLKRVQEHITTILGRYKGRIPAWHVVNEAIGRDGKLRQSKWLDIIGDDYVLRAFEYAHKVDPNVELYYNGHDILTKEVTDSIVQLVGDIKKSGGRIDGIGVQAHWELDYPSIEMIEEGIINLTRAGVKIMITEMDITVLPRNVPQKELNPYPDALPEEVQERLARRYGDLFAIFHRHAEKIERVNFWGVDDDHSWLNDWPIRGRTDYPLLFDRKLQPKPAFFTTLNAAKDN